MAWNNKNTAPPPHAPHSFRDAANYANRAVMNHNGRYEASTVIENETGIHARPAAIFVQKASKFRSNIQIKSLHKTVDAKNLLMLMSAGLSKGDKVTISAEGPDATEAVRQLVALIDSKFDRV